MSKMMKTCRRKGKQMMQMLQDLNNYGNTGREKLSEQIKEEIKQAVIFGKKSRKNPHLAAVLVGNDGASLTYVGSKVRSCEQVGFKSTLIRLESNITEEALLSKIRALNNDDTLDGYIVQLPLPQHINEEKILLAVDPKKDVDGFHPSNFGRMALEMDSFIPATPFGIMEMLKRYKIDVSGKHAWLRQKSYRWQTYQYLISKNNPGNATVTLVTKTKDIEKLTQKADIITLLLVYLNF